MRRKQSVEPGAVRRSRRMKVGRLPQTCEGVGHWSGTSVSVKRSLESRVRTLMKTSMRERSSRIKGETA